MSVSAEVGQLVRERAGRACEYGGINEVDTGGLLPLIPQQLGRFSACALTVLLL